MGGAQEGLHQGEAGVRPDGRQLGRRGGRAGSAPVRHAHRGQKRQHLVFHHIRQRADHQQLGVLRSPARPGTIASRQASSPSVKVVSIPEPE